LEGYRKTRNGTATIQYGDFVVSLSVNEHRAVILGDYTACKRDFIPRGATPHVVWVQIAAVTIRSRDHVLAIFR
jgi:hypothetical protein